MALINSGVLFQYDVVCKLHAKGGQWDQSLAGDPTQVGAILAAFDTDPDLGIVVAATRPSKPGVPQWRDVIAYTNSVLKSDFTDRRPQTPACSTVILDPAIPSADGW